LDDMKLEEVEAYDYLEDAAASREAREEGRRKQKNQKDRRLILGKKRRAKKSADLIKKGRRPKRQKAGRKSQGQRNNRGSRSGLSRASTDYTCLINSMVYNSLAKIQVSNYLAQQRRIIYSSKVAENKNGKKGIFAFTAQRIIRYGGGNSFALSCQGSTTNNGAKNLTNLAALLNGCEAKVETACATENMPLPNFTVVSACVDSMETFKGMVDTCQLIRDNGTEACDCWSNDNFTALATTIRGCKLSSDAKAVTAQLKYCKTEFSACKRAEDDAMKVMSSCASLKADLLASAKTLTQNSAGLDSAMTKMDSLANSFSSSRAAAATCNEVITIATQIMAVVAENPANPTVTTMTEKITSISSTVACTDAEKTSLLISRTGLASAKESVDRSLATINEDLEIATGQQHGL